MDRLVRIDGDETLKKDLKGLAEIFSARVEEHSRESGMTALEAIMDLHEEYGIEIEETRKFLTDHLIRRTEIEARRGRMLKTDHCLEADEIPAQFLEN